MKQTDVLALQLLHLYQNTFKQYKAPESNDQWGAAGRGNPPPLITMSQRD